MQINIPITDLEIKELMLILRKYQKGVVKVINKEAVWQTELDLTSEVSPSTPGKPAGNVFQNMAENITKSFGG